MPKSKTISNRCKFLNPALNLCDAFGAVCQYMSDPLSCAEYVDVSFIVPKQDVPSWVKKLQSEGLEVEVISIENKPKEEKVPDWF